MKTKESRFHVHDDLTAPERSAPVLKGAMAGGGQLSNIVGCWPDRRPRCGPMPCFVPSCARYATDVYFT